LGIDYMAMPANVAQLAPAGVVAVGASSLSSSDSYSPPPHQNQHQYQRTPKQQCRAWQRRLHHKFRYKRPLLKRVQMLINLHGLRDILAAYQIEIAAGLIVS